MRKLSTRTLFLFLLFSAVILVVVLLMQPAEVYSFLGNIPVLFPSGWVGKEERDLLVFIQIAMMIFIIPVYLFTFIFSWWFREGNKKATYDPHLVDHKVAEFFWWGIPLVFTVIVAIIVAYKTFELDPYRPLNSDKKTEEIQVVALQWRWLFIYPEEKIATINYFRIPKERPVRFRITADAPMNSFWLPELGGQIYAMAGMETNLHLIADKEGLFRGSSANISGEGFALMQFFAEASDEEAFNTWISEAQDSRETLNMASYEKLAAPSFDTDVQIFQLDDVDLFKKIIMKFMKPQTSE